jgi:drug/metabolite transporter (DMT)-like permease
MFVGEAGCWLVVGLTALYRRYGPGGKSASSGYQPVRTTNPDDGDAASINSEHSLLPRARPGVPDGLLRGYGILLLALPAIADICGTTLMNAGLLMVAASIYQMTRGALVLFVGLFSVVFLRRKLYVYQWLSLVGVVLGVAIVGLSGAIWPDDNASPNAAEADDDAAADALRAIIGVLLIAGAQMFTATQFVLEEFLLERSSIEPIEVVGWEGLFGLAVTLIVMLILHAAIGSTDAGRYGMFDMVEAFRQMFNHTAVLVSSFLIMISIGYVLLLGLSPPSSLAQGIIFGIESLC